MSEDALKALFQADTPVTPPARDIGFVIAVMEKVERRRLFENLAWWVFGGTAVTVILGLVMPYITPALIMLGDALVPAIIMLSLAGMVAIGAWYLRPALRDFGIRI
jgi:hypothetical protein